MGRSTQNHVPINPAQGEAPPATHRAQSLEYAKEGRRLPARNRSSHFVNTPMDKPANLNTERQDHQSSSHDINGGIPYITDSSKVIPVINQGNLVAPHPFQNQQVVQVLADQQDPHQVPKVPNQLSLETTGGNLIPIMNDQGQIIFLQQPQPQQYYAQQYQTQPSADQYPVEQQNQQHHSPMAGGGAPDEAI